MQQEAFGKSKGVRATWKSVVKEWIKADKLQDKQEDKRSNSHWHDWNFEGLLLLAPCPVRYIL